MGLEQKIVGRTGAWFRYGDMQLGQGKEKARLFLKENAQIADEIKQKVLAAGGHGSLAKSIADSDNGEGAEE
jgi:recombination protein RecA